MTSGVCGTLIDLGTLPGDDTSMATAINDLGVVVGVSEISGQTENGFVWQTGTISPVYTPGSVTDFSPPQREPHAVNHSGQIAGMAFTVAYGKDSPVVWLSGPTGGATLVAPPSASGTGKAMAINDAAQVIGMVQVCTDSTVCNGTPKRMHAFFWENGTGVDVGTLGGQATGTGTVTESSLTALNQSGLAVGWGLTASGARHAALWSGGQLKDLGTLGGSSSTAYAIDETGAVFGTSTAADGQTHAFLWAAAGMTDLGVIPTITSSLGFAFNRMGGMIGQTGTLQGVFWKDGTTSALAMTVGALNDNGEVAGSSSAGHLVVWQDGVTTDLGNLGGNSITPVAIDDTGRIMGSGTTAAGAQHAFLFQPAACR